MTWLFIATLQLMQASTSHGISFRPAQITDGETVRVWMMNPEIAHLDNPAFPTLISAEEFAFTWADVVGRHTTWMVCQGVSQREQIMGQVGWIEGANLSAELFITIAEQTDRGQGVGRKAIAWLEQQARDAGLVSLMSCVLGHNNGAQKFFTTLGYELNHIKEKQIVRNDCYFPIYTYIKLL